MSNTDTQREAFKQVFDRFVGEELDPHVGHKVIQPWNGQHRLYYDFFNAGVAWKASQKPVTDGDTSDGYHTFNELYEHRHTLFIALSKFTDSWKSRLHDDGSALDGWFIAGIVTPQGQATYHLPNRLWDVLTSKELERAPKWDGHTSDDVLLRLAALSQQPVGEEELVEVIVPCLNRKKVEGSMQRHIARTLLARFNISDRGK